MLGHAARQPAFGAAERDTLHRLLPYLAHALRERDDSALADFTDSGKSRRRASVKVRDSEGSNACARRSRSAGLRAMKKCPAAKPEGIKV